MRLTSSYRCITVAALLFPSASNPRFTMTKLLIIVGDYVEDYEVMVPFQILETAGITVHVSMPWKNGRRQRGHGHS